MFDVIYDKNDKYASAPVPHWSHCSESCIKIIQVIYTFLKPFSKEFKVFYDSFYGSSFWLAHDSNESVWTFFANCSVILSFFLLSVGFICKPWKLRSCAPTLLKIVVFSVYLYFIDTNPFMYLIKCSIY